MEGYHTSPSLQLSIAASSSPNSSMGFFCPSISSSSWAIFLRFRRIRAMIFCCSGVRRSFSSLERRGGRRQELGGEGVGQILVGGLEEVVPLNLNV